MNGDIVRSAFSRGNRGSAARHENCMYGQTYNKFTTALLYVDPVDDMNKSASQKAHVLTKLHKLQ